MVASVSSVSIERGMRRREWYNEDDTDLGDDGGNEDNEDGVE